MTNVNYAKGYRFERYIANYLRDKDIYVIRAAGSHGTFDLIAIYSGTPHGIQCKLNGKITAKEIIELRRTGERYGIIPYLAFKNGRKTIIQRVTDGTRFSLKQFVEHVKSVRLCTTY